MGKASWVSLPDFSTSAGFIAGLKPLADALVAVGLTKTSDTGQINWAGPFTPTLGAVAGYEVYRFNDAAQSGAPIFFKIEYGWSASLVSRYQLWVTVGTGSNGSGTITGTIFTRAQVNRDAAITNVTSTPTYVSYKDGNLFICGLTFSASNRTGTLFGICRSCDESTGLATTEGVYLVSFLNNSQPYVTAASAPTGGGAVAPSDAGVGCFVPQNITSTAIGADIQVYRHYLALPRVRPVIGCLTYVHAEFAAGLGSVFTVTPFGSTPRSYLPLGISPIGGGDWNGSGTSSTYALAILWED